MNANETPKTAIIRSNYVVHHNPALWGSDHDVYNPDRFLGRNGGPYNRDIYLFSAGRRMCVGRNMAMTNILGVTTTFLKSYDIEVMNPEQKITSASVGISEK